MNFAVSKDEFFDNGMHVDFIATMTAFLNLSTDQVKIVGVRSVSNRRILAEDGRVLQESSEGVAVDSIIDDDEPIG